MGGQQSEAPRAQKLHTFEPEDLEHLARVVKKLNLGWRPGESWLGIDSLNDERGRLFDAPLYRPIRSDLIVEIVRRKRDDARTRKTEFIAELVPYVGGSQHHVSRVPSGKSFECISSLIAVAGDSKEIAVIAQRLNIAALLQLAERGNPLCSGACIYPGQELPSINAYALAIQC